jgi:hypothetical protein
MTVPRRRALAFLRSGPACSISHRHGTLLDHLLATGEILGAWGATEELRLAGLCHAAYGTDGFSPHLLSWRRRADLVAVVGTAVEETVYLYASCDRSFLYPQLSRSGPVVFRDRFLHTTFAPSDSQLSDFVDLTLANELEIARGDPPSSVLSDGPSAWPSWFTSLVDQMVHRASPGVRQALSRQALSRQALSRRG